jgi:hypothetical protein
MKLPLRLLVLTLLALTVTGSLAANVRLNRFQSRPLKPVARPFYPTMPPPSGGMWMAGMCSR